MRKIFCLLGGLLVFYACEDVIDVELQTTAPRLVVNGLVRVDFTQEFVPVEIRVSETSNFFEDNSQLELASTF